MQRYKEGWCTSKDGTEIFYSVSGPGEETGEPAFVLCDGLGCDGFVWKYMVASLADRHQVIRFHYRGHGRSRPPTDLYRLAIPDLVDDLVSVLDHVGCMDPVVLAGHSMGVQVILEAHRRFPDRVAALVPICGSYGNPLDTFHDADILKKSFPFLYHLFTGFPEAVMRLWKVLLPSRIAYWTALLAGEVNRSLMRLEDLEPYFEHLSRMDAEVFARALHHASTHSARDHLPRVDVPSLVIAAENDTFTPSWLSREMAEAIPDSELLMVPKGSHAAPLEQPDLIGLRLEKFMAERLGSYSGEAWRSYDSRRKTKTAAKKPRKEATANRTKKRAVTGRKTKAAKRAASAAKHAAKSSRGASVKK